MRVGSAKWAYLANTYVDRIDGLFDNVHSQMYVPGCRLCLFHETNSLNGNIRNTAPFALGTTRSLRTPFKWHVAPKVVGVVSVKHQLR